MEMVVGEMVVVVVPAQLAQQRAAGLVGVDLQMYRLISKISGNDAGQH